MAVLPILRGSHSETGRVVSDDFWRRSERNGPLRERGGGTIRTIAADVKLPHKSLPRKATPEMQVRRGSPIGFERDRVFFESVRWAYGAWSLAILNDSCEDRSHHGMGTMAYHIDHPQLRVFAGMSRNSENRVRLSSTRLILLQHALPTTACMVELMVEGGAEIFAFIAKPYSRDPIAEQRISGCCVSIFSESYDVLDSVGYLDELLDRAIAACKKDGKKLVILEVGGYFARPLQRLTDADLAHVAGVVEDTTYGHLRYERASCPSASRF
jgi:hypothetical protein